MRTHPPSRLSAVSEDLPWSRTGFHGSLVRPSASGRVARFWPRRNDNFGQTVFVISLRPMADDAGLTRRYQRSTCVTAALPAPMQGSRYVREYPPRTLGMRAQRRFCVNCRDLPWQFSVSPEKNGHVCIPIGGMSVYRAARVGLPGWGVSVYRP